MRLWKLIMLGPGLALVGLQAVQAQVTIDVTKITCEQFLASQVTELKNPRHLAERLCEWRAWQDPHRPPFRNTHQFGTLLRGPR